MKNKPVSELTKDEQIKRLVAQRYALIRFIYHEICLPTLQSLEESAWLTNEDVKHAITLDDEEYALIDPDLFDELVERFGEKGIDRVYKLFKKVLGNVYAIEGFNPITGDEEEDVPKEIRALYKYGPGLDNDDAHSWRKFLKEVDEGDRKWPEEEECK